MGPGYELRAFDRLTLLGRRWFFRVVSMRNWKVVAQSEAYNSKAARDATGNGLAAALGTAMIEEKKS
jgi:hypothetical protein